MKGRQKRKKTVVNNLLRKENWELEAIRSDNHRAQQLLDAQNEALARIDQTLETAYSDLRRLMDDKNALKIDQLHQARLYVEKITQERVACKTQQKRMHSEAEKISTQLRQKMLYAKGLEAVQSDSNRNLLQEREKTEFRDQEELWVQRNGNRE